MDPNLSLLEIDSQDDDDSLLPQVHNGDSIVNGNHSNIFLCSPLQCFRSLPSHPPQTEGRAGAVDSEILSSSSNDSINKENINGNKSEAPKLGMEPQQMKRKKKASGYNLRKSLAWNRAFFTEEGVLNPLELSMISGNHSNGELEIIHEEGINDPSELQPLEEKLFKQLSDNTSTVDKKKIGACSLPKPAISTRDNLGSTPLAKRKVLAVNDINRSSSKRSGYPRSTTSSSYPCYNFLYSRNLIVSIHLVQIPETAKSPSKESKVLKTPVLKSNASMIITTARRGALGAGYAKRNQKAHPTNNVQKDAGAKGQPKDKVKINVTDKCSINRTSTRRAGKDLDTSISETHPPPQLQHQLEANKDSEVSASRSVCDTGVKKQQTQLPTMKPSGLRMPSPSLGFFSQTKTSNSHSLLQKSSKRWKPAESNIPKPRKIETNSVNQARPPRAPNKITETVNLAAKNCTLKSKLSDVQLRSCSQVANNQKAKVEIQSGSFGLKELGKHERIQKVLEHASTNSMEQAESCKWESISNMEDVEFQREKKGLLSERYSHMQLGKEAEHPLEAKLLFQEPQFGDHCSKQRNTIEKASLSSTMHNAMNQNEDEQMKSACDVHPVEDKLLFQEPRCIDQCSMQRDSVEDDNLSSTVNNAMKQDEDEQTKLSACDIQTSNESLVLPRKHDTSENSRYSSEFKEYNYVKITHANQVEIVACGSETKIPEEFPHPADDHLGSVHTRPVGDGYDQLLDSKVMHNRTQSDSLELNTMPEDSISVSPAVCERNTETNHIYPESRLLHESNIEYPHFTSNPCLIVQGECGSSGNDMLVDNCSIISDLQSRDDSSSRDTPTYCDSLSVEHDIDGNYEQQAGLLTHSAISEMPRENESFLANHGHLVCESEPVQVSADVNSNTKSSTLSGLASPPGYFQPKQLVPVVGEYEFTNRVIEESHVKDIQLQSSLENLVSNDDSCNSFSNDQSLLAVDNINEQSKLLEIQRPSLVAVADSEQINHKPHTDADLLPANDAARSEEIQREDLFEGVSEQCNDNGSQNSTRNHHTHATSEIKNGNLGVDESAEYIQRDDGAEKGSAQIPSLVELSHTAIANELSSKRGSEDQNIEVVNKKSNEHLSSSEDIKLQVADNPTPNWTSPLSSEISSSKCINLKEEAKTSMSDEIPNTELQHQFKMGIYPAEDSSEMINPNKSRTKNKQDAPTIKLPPNSAPFSDEWLAALEAAGEEILTRKGGAVQNSPTEKPQHEPGPWSPIRRKNQGIGPFDCTKYNNIPDSSSQ
ncbi:hypothetical protein L6164_021927 [Bauhinia variegata]|uniref:Uncharacterized protein n=1 Tax=Bauhinia variegata TaxID=167791 RepID=A0ACB9MEK3_BAUVA|nr:hypothetical protein L6164_021927 [Bauhinia variegata]